VDALFELRYYGFFVYNIELNHDVTQLREKDNSIILAQLLYAVYGRRIITKKWLIHTFLFTTSFTFYSNELFHFSVPTDVRAILIIIFFMPKFAHV
jgi:hypothetical protein